MPELAFGCHPAFHAERRRPLFHAWLPDVRVGAVRAEAALLPARGTVIPGFVFQSGMESCASAEAFCLDGRGREHRVGVAAFGPTPPALEFPDLFIYGTLLKGECRHPILQRAGLVQYLPCTAFGELFDLGEYPGMRLPESQPGAVVKGQLVRLHDREAGYDELDREEGFAGFGSPGSLFRRTLVEVQVADGSRARSWVYVLAAPPPEGARPIADGDWKAHRAIR